MFQIVSTILQLKPATGSQRGSSLRQIARVAPQLAEASTNYAAYAAWPSPPALYTHLKSPPSYPRSGKFADQRSSTIQHDPARSSTIQHAKHLTITCQALAGPQVTRVPCILKVSATASSQRPSKLQGIPHLRVNFFHGEENVLRATMSSLQERIGDRLSRNKLRPHKYHRTIFAPNC